LTPPDTIFSAALQKLRRHPAESLCAVILLIMSANLISLAASKTITNDEVVHIPPGYAYLTAHDFRLNPEHPPLVKMWATLPLLWLRPAPAAATENLKQDWGERTLTTSVSFWHQNRAHYKAIAILARLPMVALTLALGVLIFICGRRMFGPRAAVFAVALFSLEPTMLGHGWIVHTDIPAALAYLLFFFVLQSFCRQPDLGRALCFGLVTALALLTKFSLIIIVPVFLGALAYMFWRSATLEYSRRSVALHSLAAVALVLLTINAAYFFQHPFLTPEDAAVMRDTRQLFSSPAMFAVKGLARILPTYYVFGLYTVMLHNRLGHPASILGNYGTLGWWYYFPVAFALKTTLPFLLLSLSALGWSIWRAIAKSDKRILALLLPVALYLAVSMTGHINIGIRHIAPVFPFLFLLGGAGLDRLLENRRSKMTRIVVVVLLGWMVIDAVRIYPDYMSYTNELRLGRPGWQVLSDSNVEWGQDVGALANYLKQRNETQVCGALSGGWATLELYGVSLVDFAPRELPQARTKYVAVGAGMLNGSTVPGGLKDANGAVLSEEQRRDFFASYRTATPEAVFGNSIYLYRAKD
jgi:4-amino-4-deoxy-L-arabinose transferase-like glycosyltransferase